MKLKDTIEIASLDDGDIIVVNEEHDVGEIAIAGSTEDFIEHEMHIKPNGDIKFNNTEGEDLAKGTYILLKAVGTLEVK